MIRPVHSAILALMSLVPGAALAQTAATTPGRSEAVRSADLDLTREAGVKVLISRMEAAARRVCGPAPDLANLAAHRNYTGCVKDTMERAVASVNTPLVTKVYAGSQSEVLARN